MNVSGPFIRRPIATSLIGIAVMLGGLIGYWLLPVSSLPQVDFPTIQVTTQLPGANPDTMPSLITAPLERQLGQIPSLTSMTSSSAFGISQITLQFDLDREIDSAAQDVQAAINAAGSTLPRTLPYPPTYAKVNPADTPIVTLALTSPTYSLRQLSDMADTLMLQRLSEVDRRRARLGPGRREPGRARPGGPVAARQLRHRHGGSSHRDRGCQRRRRRRARSTASHQSYTIAANDQLGAADAYRGIVIAYRNGAPVVLSDVADVVEGLENTKVGGWYKGQPAVILDMLRQPGANIIETVERIQVELPRLERISRPA